MKITESYLKKAIKETLEEAQYEYSSNEGGLNTDVDDLKYVLKVISDSIENSQTPLRKVSPIIFKLHYQVTGYDVDSYELPSYSRREY